MDTSAALRKHILAVLDGAGAHARFEEAVAGVPEQLRGRKAQGAPYTLWQLLEHMRIAQWDIVEFSRDSTHVSPEFPAGYWPPTEAPPDSSAWDASVESFRRDLQIMQKLVSDPAADLFAQISHGDGQTLLREALLVADHNAYHVGEFVLCRRLLGAWK